jgi:hypothetical protein
VEPLTGRLLKVSLNNHKLDLAVISRLLADQGLYVFELTPIQPDLESVFLNLTAGDHLTARQQRGRKPKQPRPPVDQRRPKQQQRPQSQGRRRQELPDWSGRQ